MGHGQLRAGDGEQPGDTLRAPWRHRKEVSRALVCPPLFQAERGSRGDLEVTSTKSRAWVLLI